MSSIYLLNTSVDGDSARGRLNRLLTAARQSARAPLSTGCPVLMTTRAEVEERYARRYRRAKVELRRSRPVLLLKCYVVRSMARDVVRGPSARSGEDEENQLSRLVIAFSTCIGTDHYRRTATTP